MANANRGLGKGLGALLGDAALRTDTSDNLYLPSRRSNPMPISRAATSMKRLCRIWPIPSASTALSSR